MTERQQRAQELHGKGYNCAQSVVCAYCDLVGLDEQTAYKMAEGFGLGMGVMDMCGALSGAFMLAGVKGSAGIKAPGTTKAQPRQQARASRGKSPLARRVGAPTPQRNASEKRTRTPGTRQKKIKKIFTGPFELNFSLRCLRAQKLARLIEKF
mgnify:CR=1 FL=1